MEPNSSEDQSLTPCSAHRCIFLLRKLCFDNFHGDGHFFYLKMPTRPSTDSTNHYSSLVHLKVATGYMSKGFFFDAEVFDGIRHGVLIKTPSWCSLYNQGTSFAIEDWNPATHMTCKKTSYSCFSAANYQPHIDGHDFSDQLYISACWGWWNACWGWWFFFGNLVRWWPLWPILFVFFWRGDAEGLGSTCSRVFFSRWNRSFPIEICWKQASGESKDKQNSQKVMKMNIRAMRDSLCKQRWTYSWPDSDVFCQKNHHQTKQTHENREGFLMEFPQGWKLRIPKRSSRVSLEHQDAYHLDI